MGGKGQGAPWRASELLGLPRFVVVLARVVEARDRKAPRPARFGRNHFNYLFRYWAILRYFNLYNSDVAEEWDSGGTDVSSATLIHDRSTR